MRLTRKTVRTGQGTNITPMIDVVFLLIIFFMVISQFQKIELEKLDLPQAEPVAETPPAEPSRLVVNVHGDGRIIVERAEHTPETLRTLLRKEVESSKGKPPALLIRGDRAAAWERIRVLLRVCAEFKIFQVDVGIEDPGGGA